MDRKYCGHLDFAYENASLRWFFVAIIFEMAFVARDFAPSKSSGNKAFFQGIADELRKLCKFRIVFLCVWGVPMTLTLILLEKHRDTNGRRIVIQIGGV